MTLIGSTRRQQDRRPRRAGRRAARRCGSGRRRTGSHELAPLPAEVLGDACSPPTARSRSAAPNVAAKKPRITTRQAELARARPRPAGRPGRACRPGCRRAAARPRRTRRSPSDSTPPSGNPTKTLARVVTRSLRRPALLDAAGGEEEHLVGRHRRAEQGDRVVPVGRQPSPPGRAGGRPACSSAPQSGPSCHSATANTTSASPSEPEHVLQSSNLTRHMTSHTTSADDRDPQQVVDAGRQLEGQRDAADLGGERQERDAIDATRFAQRRPRARAARGPGRTSARPVTAATRPDISANTQMPTTPTTTTQASDSPNREPDQRRWPRGRRCRRTRRWR